MSPLMALVVSPVSRDLQVGFWGQPLCLVQLPIPTLLSGELRAKKRYQRQGQSCCGHHPWVAAGSPCQSE